MYLICELKAFVMLFLSINSFPYLSAIFLLTDLGGRGNLLRGEGRPGSQHTLYFADRERSCVS